MVSFILFGGALLTLMTVVGALRYFRQDRRRRKPDTLVMLATMAVVSSVLLMIALQLAIEPGNDMKTVLATGSIGAGLVTANFALWLNHRRYLVEEARQQVERDKAGLEQSRHRLEQEKVELELAKDRREHDKAAYDVLIRGADLIGHDNPLTRVAAMHALATLAAQRPDRAQEVIELICMYLRQRLTDGENLSAREVQKVLTRVIARANAASPPVTDLEIDLAEAHLHELVLDGASVRMLNLSGASLTGLTSLRRLGTTVAHDGVPHVHVNLDGSMVGGDLRLHNAWLARFSAAGAVFGGNLSVTGARIAQDVVLSDCSVAGVTELNGAEFGSLTCNAAQLGAEITLRRTTVHGTTRFVQTHFGRADLEAFTCRHRVVFDGAHFDEGPRLRDVDMRNVSLWRTTIRAAAAADGKLALPQGWQLTSADREDVHYLVHSDYQTTVAPWTTDQRSDST